MPQCRNSPAGAKGIGTKKGRHPGKPKLCLKPKEPYGNGLRNLAELQLHAALGQLKGNNVSPQAVHNARTYMKKVRSIIQIAAPSLGRARRNRLLGILRDTTSRLSKLRDAEVRVQSLDLLVKKSGLPKVSFSSLRIALSDIVRHQRAKDLLQIPHIMVLLRKLLRSVPRWPLDELEGKDLRRRIRRTYRRGQDTLKLCSDSRDPNDFHAWRKLVKQLWYQLRITAHYWPGNAEELIAITGKIGNLTGIERDYTLLAGTLSKDPKSTASTLLLKIVAGELPKLRRQAIKAGKQFYDKKPKLFIKDLKL